MSAKAYKNLCNVRDELRLFAGVAAKPSLRNPQTPICRVTLAYCLDHLAQQVENVVMQVDERATDSPATANAETPSTRYGAPFLHGADD